MITKHHSRQNFMLAHSFSFVQDNKDFNPRLEFTIPQWCDLSDLSEFEQETPAFWSWFSNDTPVPILKENDFEKLRKKQKERRHRQSAQRSNIPVPAGYKSKTLA